MGKGIVVKGDCLRQKYRSAGKDPETASLFYFNRSYYRVWMFMLQF